jgi:hypothetical protein
MGAIILIMHRLHEDDLAGHVMAQEDWEIVRFPAIAEDDEAWMLETALGPESFTRQRGEALHPERQPLASLDQIRRTIGEYNFAGQYQQMPAPQGGGMVKAGGSAVMQRTSGPRSSIASCRAGTLPTRPPSSAISASAPAGGSRARTFIFCTYCASGWNIPS